MYILFYCPSKLKLSLSRFGAVYLDSGLVEVNVMKSLLVPAELALQFVDTYGFFSECVQLIAVGPSRASVGQQLVALQEYTNLFMEHTQK